MKYFIYIIICCSIFGLATARFIAATTNFIKGIEENDNIVIIGTYAALMLFFSLFCHMVMMAKVRNNE